MASPSKLLSLLFLFLVVPSLQVHARDSQFFSKVTPYNTNEAKDTELTPQKEVSNSFKQEEQPRFTQESRNGYGLYGHDEVDQQFSPSTTTTTTSSNEARYGTSSNLPAGDEFSRENFDFDNNHYENKQYSLSDNRWGENGYKGGQYNKPENYNYNGYKTDSYNGYKDEQYNNNNGYKSINSNDNNDNGYRTEEYSNNNYNGYKGDQYSNNNNYNGYKSSNNMYQNEKKGMSDTRYLENGRYFYDVNKPHPNSEFGSTASNRGVESRNQYYNGGFNGNKNANEFRNSVGGYQNNEEFDP